MDVKRDGIRKCMTPNLRLLLWETYPRDNLAVTSRWLQKVKSFKGITRSKSSTIYEIILYTLHTIRLI